MKANKAPLSSMGPTEQQQINMMKDLNCWPRWPWLPLKHRSEMDAGMRKLAVMHADHAEPPKVRVYLGSMYEQGKWFPLPDSKYLEFDSLEAVLAAGWEID